ncbi:MAG: hypothetical protein FWH17_06760 [Oscillospiraceae bacterium]|nr:hypothetical protein [Oscillospiraceae bacterium]
MQKEDILNEFIKCKGAQFDPQVCGIVIEMIKQDGFDHIDVNKIIDLSDDEITENPPNLL